MQYKRIIISCLIVVLLLCASVFAIGAADATPLEISVGVADATPAVIKAGEEFTVEVNLVSNPGVSVFKLELAYDAENVELVSATNGEIFSAEEPNILTLTDDENIVKFQFIGDANVDTTGTVVTLVFKAKNMISADGSFILLEDQISALHKTEGGVVFYGEQFADGGEVIIVGNPEPDVEGGDIHTHVLTKTSEYEATCTEDAYVRYTCSTCDGFFDVVDADSALGHTEVVDPAKAATCTETGLTEGKHCSVCNEIFVAQEVVEALGHTEVVDAAKAPNCTEKGLTEGKHCSVCNEVLVAQNEIAALGHKIVIEEAVEPTYSATGRTEGKTCSVCDAVIVAQEVIPQKDGAWIWVSIIVSVAIVAIGAVCVYWFGLRKKSR